MPIDTDSAPDVLTATSMTDHARDAEQVFEVVLSKSEASSGIGTFLEVSKEDGKYSLSLTAAGEELNRSYESASRLADEKGMDDRDVLALLGEVESKWPSHPGVVENSINEAIEAGAPERAIEICERAL
ncbi:MAG TPA: hypothetical protein VFD13_07720, partial [Candidatus Kapabacteria bacterium]|nr:hypothetical protein [Candidatus Kapabacteria bacterium]